MPIRLNKSKNRAKLLNVRSVISQYISYMLIFISVIISLQLLYIGPSSAVHSLALDISGKIVEIPLKGYNLVLHSIQYIKGQLRQVVDLRAENITLKLELTKFKTLQDAASITYKENERLKAQLHYAEELPYDSITGRIVSLFTGPYGKSAIVRGGSSQGVEMGQIVINNDGVLGRISDVGFNYSKVILVTDFSSRIPVISSLSSIQAIVAGNNSEHPDLLYAVDTSNIKLGEILITSGDGKYYPPGLKVAIVSKISDREIQITPSSSLHDADFVHIIKMTHN
ncbi:MAG: rod shape-determining protein MreC [Pseudomonadota bacterium]